MIWNIEHGTSFTEEDFADHYFSKVNQFMNRFITSRDGLSAMTGSNATLLEIVERSYCYVTLRWLALEKSLVTIKHALL